MLHANNVPGKYRAEAITTASLVINKLPQPRLDFVTPFEKLWTKKPAVSYLRVFGCVCYVFVLDHLRSKIDRKAVRCIFVKYDNQRKGWKCCDPTTGRCYTSRNVVFDEASSWWTSEKEIAPITEEFEKKMEQKMSEHIVQIFPSSDGDIRNDDEPNVTKNPCKSGMSTTTRRANVRYANAAIIEEIEPETFEEASQKSKWITSMKDEINSLQENQTWELVSKPHDVKPIFCK
ncbi:hypothetical protein DCAR_0205499 [Daucus carota subsp. sativus]|uniref:Retroviral polymerase SH3-like domain-containing protein n=1 Tax=Daucus carota subsp. sativus TaxID=79200 RepID=A0AAF0WDJ4_DAUCS|nr:hypothetical protein DCAR_0205499 [Daucus carota subsp. sativus]